MLRDMLNIKQRHVKEHLEQVRKGKFFFHSAEFYNDCIFFCLRKCFLHFLCSMLRYLFMYENVQTTIKGKTLYIFCIVNYIRDHSKILFAENCWFLTLLSQCSFLLVLKKLPPLYTSINVIILLERWQGVATSLRM